MWGTLDDSINEETESDDAFWNVSNPGASAKWLKDYSTAAEALEKLKQKEDEKLGGGVITPGGGNDIEDTVESVGWSGEKVGYSSSRLNDTSSKSPALAAPSVSSKLSSAASSSATTSNTRFPVEASPTPGHHKNSSIGSVGAASVFSSSSLTLDNAIIGSSTPKKEYSRADYDRLDNEYKKLRNKFEQLNRERCRPGEVSDTVERMIDGKPFILEYHRKLEDKIELLNRILEYGDGNLIVMVLLFLKNTLSYALFQAQLLKNPLAANHYIAYLREHFKYEDLTTTLFALGRKDEAAMVEFQLACNKSSIPGKIAALKRCYQDTFSANTNLSNECQQVAEYVSLLERQMPVDASDDKTIKDNRHSPTFKQFPKTASLIDTPVLTTLYYCCMYHYELPVNSFASPLSMREHHKLTDKQFAWIGVRALAKQQRWMDIQKLLTSKTLLGGSKIKSPIPVDSLVVVLAKCGALPETLSIYVRLIDDPEKRLQLATKYKCHDVVIDCLVAAKDRLKLTEYGTKLTSHTKEAYYLEAVLRNSANKWKN